MEQNIMEQKTSRKKMVITGLSVVLLLVICIGGTLAWLNDRTESKVNKMTFVNGGDPNNELTGTLVEEWNPEDGLDLVPGQVITKKPWIENNSTANVTEWAAMQVFYEKLDEQGNATVMTEAEAAVLLGVISVDYDLTTWELDSAATTNSPDAVYYYKIEIAKGEVTAPLFTEVTVLESANNDNLAALAAFAPGGINIRLEGAVMQSQGVTYDLAKTELKATLAANLPSTAEAASAQAAVENVTVETVAESKAPTVQP